MVRLPRIAAALAAVTLSLSVVLAGPARPAAAITTPSPVVIGTAIRAAPMAGPAVVTCAATVVCAGIVAAGGLGYLAFSTRDSWMPMVQGWFNRNNATGKAGQSGCLLSLTSPTPINDAQVGGRASATVVWGGDCVSAPGQAQISLTLGLQNRRCIVTQADAWYWAAAGRMVQPGGVVPLSGDSWVDQTFPAQQGAAGSGDMLVNLGCPSGTSPYAADLRANKGSEHFSQIFELLWKVPDAYWTNKTDVTCKRPNGSTFTTSGTEMGFPDRISADSCYADDPSSVPVGLTVSGPDGGPVVTWNPPDWFTEFPNCFGPSGLLCEIFVAVNGVRCEVGQALCTDWYNRTEDPSLACQFGAYVIPWARCEALKRSYKPGATPTEVTDPVGWPPGDPAPNPTPTPTPPPTPTPTPSHNPQPCNTNCPNPVPPQTPDPQGSESSCLGAMWSWNPVDWVYVPVKCVLMWAFVPSPGFLDGKVQDLSNAFQGTMPGAFVAAFTAQTYDLSDTGCGGIPVEWSMEGKTFRFDFLAACSGAMASASAVVKLAGSAVLVVFGAIGCLRGLGAGFGWSPSMGRGGDSA